MLTRSNICSLIGKCDTGTVKILGEKATELSDDEIRRIRREDIGYIFQDYNLFEELTVEENLDLFSFLVKGAYKDNDFIDKKEEILKNLNLDTRRNVKAKLLSGGERQRVTIARTLLFPKKILFADEPSANIDSQNVDSMINLFKELLKSGTCLVIASHDNVFDSIIDEKYHIEDGMITYEKFI